MMIEFQCGNLMGYDKAVNRYIECGNRIIVSDEKVGEMVTCPKCQQQVEVPFESHASKRTKSAAVEAPQKSHHTKRPAKAVQTAAKSGGTDRRKPKKKGAAKQTTGRGDDEVCAGSQLPGPYEPLEICVSPGSSKAGSPEMNTR